MYVCQRFNTMERAGVTNAQWSHANYLETRKKFTIIFKNTTTLLNFLGICLDASNIAISHNEYNNSEFKRVNPSSEVRHEALGQFPGMFEAPSNNTSSYRTLCSTGTRTVNRKVHVTE